MQQISKLDQNKQFIIKRFYNNTVIMVQDNRYQEAIQYYEPIVKKSGDNILAAPAIVLANLCVSYIMTNRVLILFMHFLK